MLNAVNSDEKVVFFMKDPKFVGPKLQLAIVDLRIVHLHKCRKHSMQDLATRDKPRAMVC